MNKLSLNIGKTHFMVFTNEKKRLNDLNILIDGTRIEEVKKTKFLGVIIDNKLSWKDHVAHVVGKVSRGLGMIIKARHYLNKQGLLTLYYPFVYPYLTYCNHIWGNIYQSNLKQLCVTQNKIVRVIAGVKPRGSAEPLYESLSIIKLNDINKFLLADLCTNTLSAWYQNYSHPIIKKIMKYRLMTFEMLTVIIYHLLPRILAKMEYGTEGQCSSIKS